MPRRQTLTDRLMQEHISLGGQLLTRAEAHNLLIAEENGNRVADWFAFGSRALTDEEINAHGTDCVECGSSWLGPQQHIESCAHCEGRR